MIPQTKENGAFGFKQNIPFKFIRYALPLLSYRRVITIQMNKKLRDAIALAKLYCCCGIRKPLLDLTV